VLTSGSGTLEATVVPTLACVSSWHTALYFWHLQCIMHRIGHNHIYTTYMTVYLVISLLKNCMYTIYRWLWLTLFMQAIQEAGGGASCHPLNWEVANECRDFGTLDWIIGADLVYCERQVALRHTGGTETQVALRHTGSTEAHW